jgi:uncharacterized protein
MTNYQLAKIVQLAGGLKSRKRIQKTVHLLQAAGCDFWLQYRLHYYGPYCAELAEKVDRMTSHKILVESTKETELGKQYDYEFNDSFAGSLAEYEETPDGRAAREMIERYKPLLDQLVCVRPRPLELASTVAFFRKTGLEWDESIAKTAEFKQEPADSNYMREARRIAERACAFDG